MTLCSVYGAFIIGWLWSAQHTGMPLATILQYLGAGLGSWTLVEYVLHRWIFHRRWRHQSVQGMSDAWHLDHHAAPDDPGLLHAQLPSSLPLYLFFFALCYLCTDLWRAGVWISGLSLGYLLYEWFHHIAHTRVPKSRLGRTLKRYHLIHHYAEPDRAYGVTSPLWDIIFRTRPRRRAPVMIVRGTMPNVATKQ